MLLLKGSAVKYHAKLSLGMIIIYESPWRLSNGPVLQMVNGVSLRSITTERGIE